MFPLMGANEILSCGGPILQGSCRMRLHAVVSPGPDGAQPEFLHAAWHGTGFVQGVAAVADAEIPQESFQRRRAECQAWKFDAVAIHIQDNSLILRNNQSAQDSKFWSFPTKELDDEVGILQRAGINNHYCYFSE